jgi:hypothetical protein
MIFKAIVGIIAALLLLIYVAPVVVKLNEFALWAVAGLAIAMMFVDLWQSFRAKDD